MEQSAAREVLIHRHATSARDRQIADELNARVELMRGGEQDDPDYGAPGVLAPVG